MKKCISLAICIFMLLSVTSVAVYANGEVVAAYIPVDDFFDNDELFAAFVDREFYPEYEMSVWGTSAREQLNEKGKKLYDSLKANIEKIAKGTQTDTNIEISSAMLQQWGITYKFSTSTHTTTTAMNSVDNELQSRNVVTALLHDCPYDFYWFDKTAGWNHGVSTSSNGSQITVTKYRISFSVANAYRSNNYTENSPATNASKTSATATAVANANAIVEKYKGLSDYEKLVKYKEEICSLVAYNYDAAEDPNPVYGDPWQIIYVFDKNTNTNVVCEGYSKAFQYLCDRTSFSNGNIACYTVSGITQYNGNQGGHMWNIVTMDDGKNYIADVTNSDDGAVGEDGGLFLGGMSGNIDTYYKRFNSRYMYYAYYSDTESFWGTDSSSILNLASADYTPPTTHTCTPKDNAWYKNPTKHWKECSCGAHLQEDNHDNGTWITITNAGVDQDGYSERRCTVCAHVLETKTTLATHAPATDNWESNANNHWQECGCGVHLNETAHDQGSWKVTTPTQVGVIGEKGRRCTVCNYLLETADVPALEPEHTHRPENNSWQSDSSNHWKECGCGEHLQEASHDNGRWETVSEPQIGIEGKKELRCTVCGYAMDEDSIPALEEEIPDPAPDPVDGVIGDVNLNGKIDARDYLLLKRAYFGTFTLDCADEIADINGNGKIDARDYLLLKRAYFGTYTIG